jgi:tetratricopeptide (TPR) repeat protein
MATRALPALCLALATAPAAAQQPQRTDSYRQLLARYAEGERAPALAGLEQLAYNDSIHGYGELKAQAEALAKRADDPQTTRRRDELAELQALLRAGVMLHWDRDDAERPPSAGNEAPRACPGRHAELAGRYAALLARWPGTRGFALAFFATASNASQWEFCLEAALGFARDGLKLFPREPLLLLAAGSVLEQRATLAAVRPSAHQPMLGQRARDERSLALSAREGAFKDARRYLEDALGAQPALALARVRLGRVSWQLRDRAGARAALERAVAERPEPPVLYLAHLFLGQVHEDAGLVEEALVQYRAALALDPSAQVAAVALSHALRLAGDVDGSRQVLLQALAHAGRRRTSDVYWNYFQAHALGFEERLDALRRETLR